MNQNPQQEEESAEVDGAAENGVGSSSEIATLTATNSSSAASVEGADELEVQHALSFPVVGIGGSAGSIDPFMEVFHKLPVTTGMAFVVILHLLPTQESRLREIIARQTSMPVHQINDGMVIEADHIYVIPPNFSVLMERDRLRLVPRTANGPFLPVNTLFQSLAAVQKNFAIGVVLSGMDGDGALGMRAIKGEGGFSLVQSPASAREPSMPTTSIANDHVDMVLEPGEIAVQLARLGRRFRDTNWLRLEEGKPSPSDERDFARVLKLLKGVSASTFGSINRPRSAAVSLAAWWSTNWIHSLNTPPCYRPAAWSCARCRKTS